MENFSLSEICSKESKRERKVGFGLRELETEKESFQAEQRRRLSFWVQEYG